MSLRALNLELKGILQGVGFRPFVYNLAHKHTVRGWVRNNGAGAEIEAQADSLALDHFVSDIRNLRLPGARLDSLHSREIAPRKFTHFEIRGSDEVSPRDVSLGVDTAACAECLKELFDPLDRRYLYPFITCTSCGPRYSIARRPPFDRERTSMSRFQMCDACNAEYRNPLNRRFHSQTNSCSECGPTLTLWDRLGRVTAGNQDAVQTCVELLRGGKIVAIKGVGGFQLLADARSDATIVELRARKDRGEKPFALLLGSISQAKAYCELSELEQRVVESGLAPIVLVSRKSDAPLLARAVAPGLSTLGVMLACSPLHSMIAHLFSGPLVATSGNRSEEPLCADENQAQDRLSGIADAFLVHDRVIENPVDDSVVRVIAQRPVVLRRARGYVPSAISIPPLAQTILALGSHFKNTVALGRGDRLFLGPHIGSLDTVASVDRWRREAAALANLYGTSEVLTSACDLHPDYASSIHASDLNHPSIGIQHHYAHVLSCLADNCASPPVLGVAWDGSGYGTDHSIWGGEFIKVHVSGEFERVAHLRSFHLIGGEQAVQEPRRAALGLLHALYGDEYLSRLPEPLASYFRSQQLQLFAKMLRGGVNSPACTSIGRLFDAVAALIGLRSSCSYEGQAAIELEHLASQCAQTHEADSTYSLPLLKTETAVVLDWGPLVESIVADLSSGAHLSLIAWRFHAACASSIVSVARSIEIKQVALTGGVFQNKLLTELAAKGLQAAGFEVLLHQNIPPNDGGIAAGQVYAMTFPHSLGNSQRKGRIQCA